MMSIYESEYGKRFGVLQDMNDFMSRCIFPRLEEKYDTALKEIVNYAFQRYNPVGIIASGTIILGNPDASSDFDMHIIHMEPYRMRVQKFFNGIPTELFVNPPTAFDQYFEESKQRPCMANMLATGIVIFQSEPVIDEIREKAGKILVKAPEVPEPDLTMSRYSSVLFLEDALDLLEKDPATTDLMLNKAVFSMLEYYFQSQLMFHPRFKDLISVLSKLDPELGKLVGNFYLSKNLGEKTAIAEKIADITVEARGFFEWETTPEVDEKIMKLQHNWIKKLR